MKYVVCVCVCVCSGQFPREGSPVLQGGLPPGQAVAPEATSELPHAQEPQSALGA